MFRVPVRYKPCSPRRSTYRQLNLTVTPCHHWTINPNCKRSSHLYSSLRSIASYPENHQFLYLKPATGKMFALIYNFNTGFVTFSPSLILYFQNCHHFLGLLGDNFSTLLLINSIISSMFTGL